MHNKPSLILATVLLGCLYSMPLYINLGGGYTLIALVALWFLLRSGEAVSGEKTWLRGLKDYSAEFLCLGMFAIVIILNIIEQRGIAGMLHLAVIGRYLLALFIICSYSRVPFVTPHRFAFSVFLVLGLFAWISIPTLIENPMLPRLTQLDEELYLAMLHKGITRYNAYASGAIVFPCLVAAISSIRGKVGKLFFAVLGLGIALAIVLSGFMAALTTLVGTSLLIYCVMVWRAKTARVQIATLGILLIGTLIIGGAWLLGVGSEGLIYSEEKAARIFQGIVGGGLAEGDETGRYDLFLTSARTFLQQPWFGIGPVTGADLNEALQATWVGGHASLLDQLAEYGVVGFGWYLLLLGLLTKRVLRGLRFGLDPLFSKAVAIVWVAFLVTSIYNMTTWVPDIVVLVFGFTVVNSFPHCEIHCVVERVVSRPEAASPCGPVCRQNGRRVSKCGSAG